MKYVDYVLRMFSGHLISLAYNLLIVVGVVLLTPVHLSAADFVLLLTVPLFMVAILGVCFFLSVVAARYPDIAELMRTVLRLFFFITPIIWMPSMGKGAVIGAFIYLNPFYYLIEIIRGPLVYGHRSVVRDRRRGRCNSAHLALGGARLRPRQAVRCLVDLTGRE